MANGLLVRELARVADLVEQALEDPETIHQQFHEPHRQSLRWHQPTLQRWQLGSQQPSNLGQRRVSGRGDEALAVRLWREHRSDVQIGNIAHVDNLHADWCGDCRRSERLLNELNVEYTKIDTDADVTAADKVIEINGGAKSIPVIVFSDGTHLTEPSDNDLKAKLTSLGII